MRDPLHEETRKLYQAQHERLVSDKAAFRRMHHLVEPHRFGVEPEWFRGKEAIDIGCGNVGALITRLVKLGTARVCGIDIGSDWIPKLKEVLLSQEVSLGAIELTPGNALDVPYATQSFDFVAIDGVLIVLKDMAEVVRGFNEGARVCKSGGYLYTTFGPCQGLVQGAIFPAVRQYYQENSSFKQFIDELTASKLASVIEKICKDAKSYANQDLNPDWLKSLFGEDFCVFLQNYIQPKTWLSNECTPELVEELYKANGFKNIRRLKSYIERSDVRKYFAPLHFDRDNDVSQVLYGKGFVEYVGQKA